MESSNILDHAWINKKEGIFVYCLVFIDRPTWFCHLPLGFLCVFQKTVMAEESDKNKLIQTKGEERYW